MIVPDINLLLYAHVEAFPMHGAAREWWEHLLNDTRPVGVVPPVVFGFVRIATMAKAFDPPMSIEAALATVTGWLSRPNVHLLQPGPKHLQLAFGLLERLGTAGNLTTDVQIAAHAIENRGEIHSNDTDFARIPDVRWINPLQRP